ncbi:molybdopterin molybdotransferase MoeA [Aquimarina sp. U1-2]|uniref:molybdopterin molybdotransferase MoeA n=1 Tax=Aquimarina sp. U1-2 TaxID=2823141 RepID=UPI001AED0C0B|nr:gephyrin-like molybdotransferase Glp [Aquimarina sp. U1-2]MBP2831508.1 molybdopterin molybdotransferase MoeA [Aquimarina sp. U1-2]
MIPVEKALALVDQYTEKTKNILTVSLSEALGATLANDVISPIHMPPFRQSAMDGYALGSIEENKFNLVGEVQAGDNSDPVLQKDEAIRIFTGAPVPSTAKSVIMQEKTKVVAKQLFLDEPAKKDANIRPLAEQIKQGDLALPKGTFINAASIGYLATLGVTHVEVYKKPSIAIIATGNELIKPGQELKHGQIYESNSIMLSTALQTFGFKNTTRYKVEDDYDATLTLLKKVLQQHDVILISGGISVGDYDFVGKVLRELQVKEIFYKVKQKPGKPLYFAKKEHTTIFALPGNPASSLSCFYIYVLPALQKISGVADYHLKRNSSISNSTYSKKGVRAEFLKATLKDGKATILDGQASSMLRSFAIANVLLYIPEEISEINPGDTVQIIPINQMMH